MCPKKRIINVASYQNIFYIKNVSVLKLTMSEKNNFSCAQGGQNMIMDRIALILTIIGALNWGSIGLFQFDIVAWICGGQDALFSRIIYTVVALAGIWCISLIFRARERFESIDE